MIEELHQAVYELLAEGCKRENLVICYSPLVKRLIEEELYEKYFYLIGNNSFTKFEGIDTSDIWPYNEIVVYDSFKVCYYPELIRKIQVALNTNINREAVEKGIKF